MLRPQTVFALATSLVGVWLCAPSRLALSWDTNFQARSAQPRGRSAC